MSQLYSPHQARTPMVHRPSKITVLSCLNPQCQQWLAMVVDDELRFGNAIIRSRIELTCTCCGRKRVWRPSPKPKKVG